jgi:hypothetical protein
LAASLSAADIDLSGDWRAERNGAVVANCSIAMRDGRLEFVIHRNPPERSRGRFLNQTTVIADDWGDQAVIADSGNLLRWRNSQWRRVGGGAPATPPPASLTGPWAHSADPRAQTTDNRVVLVQEGSAVSMTHTYKTNGKWVTAVCQGPVSGQALKMQCRWAPGGNPFSFANYSLALTLSADGNRLDGTLSPAAGSAQESHFSRLP